MCSKNNNTWKVNGASVGAYMGEPMVESVRRRRSGSSYYFVVSYYCLDRGARCIRCNDNFFISVLLALVWALVLF